MKYNWLWYIALISYDLAKLSGYIRLCAFLRVFFMGSHVVCKKDSFFFSYPIPMAFFYSFIYSFIVLYLTELPVQCWIEVRRHSCLLLILEEKYWVFCYEFNVSCGFYIDGFCQVEDFLSYFKFSDSFYDEKNWILSNVFLHLFGHKDSKFLQMIAVVFQLLSIPVWTQSSKE